MSEHSSQPPLPEKKTTNADKIMIGAPAFVLRSTENGPEPEPGWTITAIDHDLGTVTVEKGDGKQRQVKETAPGTLDLFVEFQEEMQKNANESLGPIESNKDRVSTIEATQSETHQAPDLEVSQEISQNATESVRKSMATTALDASLQNKSEEEVVSPNSLDKKKFKDRLVPELLNATDITERYMRELQRQDGDIESRAMRQRAADNLYQLVRQGLNRERNVTHQELELALDDLRRVGSRLHEAKTYMPQADSLSSLGTRSEALSGHISSEAESYFKDKDTSQEGELIDDIQMTQKHLLNIGSLMREELAYSVDGLDNADTAFGNVVSEINRTIIYADRFDENTLTSIYRNVQYLLEALERSDMKRSSIDQVLRSIDEHTTGLRRLTEKLMQ